MDIAPDCVLNRNFNLRSDTMKHQHLDEKPARTRRAFLKGAAAAGVAGVTGAAAGVAAADLPAAESTTAPAEADHGYRETAHIRAYYRAARF